MCRKHSVKRVVQISFVEVYGPIPKGSNINESAGFAPVSPYAASKAACDLLTQSYHPNLRHGYYHHTLCKQLRAILDSG
ncbi:dTDP-D-glucose 4,6-dehydratase [Paenibacillus sp. DS2015]